MMMMMTTMMTIMIMVIITMMTSLSLASSDASNARIRFSFTGWSVRECRASRAISRLKALKESLSSVAFSSWRSNLAVSRSIFSSAPSRLLSSWSHRTLSWSRVFRYCAWIWSAFWTFCPAASFSSAATPRPCLSCLSRSQKSRIFLCRSRFTCRR